MLGQLVFPRPTCLPSFVILNQPNGKPRLNLWHFCGSPISPSEIEGIMVCGAAIDRVGQILHARCGELPPEDLDRTPHGFGRSMLVP